MLTVTLIVLLGVNAALLAYVSNYDDGFIGKASLGSLCLGAAIVAITQGFGHAEYEAPLEIDLVLAGAAGFLARHTYRWHRYTRGKGRRA